ncbi:MAG TPA: amidohydrolase family protein [Bryobacteraceae bacterium]|nr:amidohydrolase family protein [Bryobacteraceae bacterium]
MLAAAIAIALTHVTVIDGTGALPKENQTVLIRDGRIAGIGDVPIPKGANTIDATGKYLIPGLWDMHTHVLVNPERHFPKLLASGVIGIRNMHVPTADPMKAVSGARKLAGPHIVANGPIIDGPRPVWPYSVPAADAGSARTAVEDLKRAGADFFKVYDFLPRDAYFALAAEARKLRMPMVGHVPLAVTAEEAARAGQKSIEHLSGVFEACTANGSLERQMRLAVNLWRIAPQHAAKQMQSVLFEAASTYDAGLCRPLYDVFVEKGTWHCPTLVVLRQVRRAGVAVVRDMHEAGVKLLAGTDAGNPDSEPGDSLHRELELLVEAGLTPMAAVQTATRNAAEFLGRLNESGTIEKGKQADLVLLDGNPLEDIRATRRVAAVILNGRIVSR